MSVLYSPLCYSFNSKAKIKPSVVLEMFHKEKRLPAHVLFWKSIRRLCLFCCKLCTRVQQKARETIPVTVIDNSWSASARSIIKNQSNDHSVCTYVCVCGGGSPYIRESERHLASIYNLWPHQIRLETQSTSGTHHHLEEKKLSLKWFRNIQKIST